MITFEILPVTINDIKSINELSYQKRRFYEKHQPQFWKWAGKVGEEIQCNWFAELIGQDDYVMLIAKKSDEIKGFIIGKIIPAPEVYNPGGKTLMIDDFCVKDENWDEIGGALIKAIKQKSLIKEIAQIVVVCGAQDEAKKQFLSKINLTIASEWYIGKI